MRLTRRTVVPVPSRSAFAGFRFPREVIVLAVRWYLRFGLSYRDVEELLADRGIEVDHVTVHRWVQRLTPLLVDAARFGRHRVGDRWHLDETYVKVAGRWVYLYRAVDRYGQVIDVYASTRRDTEVARRFFQRAKKPQVWCLRRSSPTGHPPTRGCSTGCGRQPGTTWSGTPITGSSPTTRS
jgi:transposase-like protein